MNEITAEFLEVQKEGDTCIPMADLCWCFAETNKIL